MEKAIGTQINLLRNNSIKEQGKIIKSCFPSLADKIINRAEDAYNDMLILPGTNGIPAFVGNPPKWYEYPGKNKEYLFSLNRLEHLKLLSEAYNLTGDLKYAKKTLEELENWVDTVIEPEIWTPEGNIIKENFETCTPYRALEVGIRCYRTLPFIIQLTAETEFFTKSLYEKIIKSVKKHMEVLYNVSPVLWPKADHNHYLMENLGLMSVSLLFPDLDKDKIYLNHASRELDRCMENQCTENGAQIEGCPSYHNGCLYWFSLRNSMAKHYGIDVPEKYTNQLKKMAIHSVLATRPCGGNFPWGDSHTADKETMALGALGYYMATDDIQFLEYATNYISKATIEKDIMGNLWRIKNLYQLKYDLDVAFNNPKKPNLPLFFFDQCMDQAYYRSSWDTKATSIMTACRVPVKNLHAHMDPGGFDLVSNNRPLISDPGIYTYRDDEDRHFFKSTLSHNCATINGKEAWQYLGSWAYGPQGEGHIISAKQYDDIYIITSSHNCYKPITLIRSLVIKNDIIIVIDKAENISNQDDLKVFFNINSTQYSDEKDETNFYEKKIPIIKLKNLYGEKYHEFLEGYISEAIDIKQPSTRLCYTAVNDLLITLIVPSNHTSTPNDICATVYPNEINISIGLKRIVIDNKTLQKKEN